MSNYAAWYSSLFGSAPPEWIKAQSVDLLGTWIFGILALALLAWFLWPFVLGLRQGFGAITVPLQSSVSIARRPTVVQMSPDSRVAVVDRIGNGLITYCYHMLRIKLSEGGDWPKHLSVELTDSDVWHIKRYVPTKLRMYRIGASEVVVDVFRAGIHRPSDGPLQLTWEGFSDSIKDMAPGIYEEEQMGIFHPTPSTLTISVLLDNRILKKKDFKIHLLADGKLKFT